VDLGLLKTYADIYNLKDKRDELINIERLGEKSVDNLLGAIEASKKQPFSKTLFAIGIRYVGSGAAKKLTDHFSSIQELMKASEDEISSVHEIGPSISISIKDFFANKINSELVQRLINHGLIFKSEKKKIEENFFKGKSFVLTGTLEKFSRDEAGDKIQMLGGRVSSSVSKKTDYLVAGESAGSKMTKAKELGVKILDEDEFIKLLHEAGA
jgi:DNA ligase (NAD+)